MTFDWNFNRSIAFEEVQPQAIQKCKTADCGEFYHKGNSYFFFFFNSGFIIAAEMRLEFWHRAQLSSSIYISVIFFWIWKYMYFYYWYVIKQYV